VLYNSTYMYQSGHFCRVVWSCVGEAAGCALQAAFKALLLVPCCP
jgi:hypothetical protein